MGTVVLPPVHPTCSTGLDCRALSLPTGVPLTCMPWLTHSCPGQTPESEDSYSALCPLTSKGTNLYFPDSRGAAEQFGLAVFTVNQIRGRLVI